MKNFVLRSALMLVLLWTGTLLFAQDSGFLVKDRVLVKYQGRGQNVVIPQNLGINRIGERAFAGSGITSIIIPVGVDSIGSRAFINCSFLKLVSLPNTLSVIGDGAFFNCGLLQTVNLPRSLQTIEGRAFFNCRSITEISVPDTLRYIGDRAFSGCVGLNKFSLSRRTKLGDHVFMGIPCSIDYKD